MATNITLNITATNKTSYRKQLIEEFLNEQPGTINSVTEYYYFVETLQIIIAFILSALQP